MYPVVDENNEVDEWILGWSLECAVFDTKADVIVMCVELAEKKGSFRDNLERRLKGVTDKPVVIAASGNRNDSDPLTAKYPGIHPVVMMVGAVDRNKVRPDFSCYALNPEPQPALFVVAPGGVGPAENPLESSVIAGDQAQVGTSIAAAYAAGVVARSLAGVEEDRALPPQSVVYKLFAAEAEKDRWPDWKEAEHGRGLIRQIDLPTP